MSEVKPAAQMSIGEYVSARVEAKIADWNRWAAKPEHEELVWLGATAGASLLTAGIEVTADLVSKGDGPKARLESIGLHTVAVATGAAAMLFGITYGSIAGEHETKKKHRIKM